jgi:HNH endonuclease
MTRISATLRDRVRERAGGYCEYCGLPEEYSPTHFEADHVLPEQHGGPTEFNLDFPDDSLISAWRLRLLLGKPSVSDDFLPK